MIHNQGTMAPATSLIERSPVARGLMLIFCFGALTALGAQAKLYLPFTPVPVTFQVFFVILSGLMLGSRLGAISQLQYLAMGFAGLPVFAGIPAGPLAIAGPTGGYLIGFVVAAYLVGLTREKISGSFGGVLAVSAGIFTIYFLGSLHLAFIALGGNLGKAFALGAAPFILVDTAKAILALGISGGISRMAGKI